MKTALFYERIASVLYIVDFQVYVIYSDFCGGLPCIIWFKHIYLYFVQVHKYTYNYKI